MGTLVPMPFTTVDKDFFDRAMLEAGDLADLMSRLTGAPVRVDAVETSPIALNWGAITTAGAWRVDVVGHADDRRVSQRFFVKLLRHPRLWPMLDLVPAGASREEFVSRMPWKLELDLYRAGVGELLPPGLRTPTLHATREYDADQLAMWWEFIETRPSAWELADYERVAYLLGQLAARRRVGAAVNARLPSYCRDVEPGGALRYYTEHRVLLGMAPQLRSGEVWRHPTLVQALAAVGDPQLPADMVALLDRLPAILDVLQSLPQTYGHGDASPQNFLMPADSSAELVLVDWGFASPLPVGFDLAQLMVGLANMQLCPLEMLPSILEAILPAYKQGLAMEGYDADPAVLRTSVIGSLATRTALVALPFEILDRPHESQTDDMWVNQLQLTRYLVDLAADLP